MISTQGRFVDCETIIELSELDDFDRKLLNTLHEMVNAREKRLKARHELNPFYKRKPGDTAIRAIDLKKRVGCTQSKMQRSILKMSRLWHEPIYEDKDGTYTVYGI